jgi:AmmeMemoRadiSam system protein A
MSFTDSQHKLLLDIARRSIEHGLYQEGPLPVKPEDFEPALREWRATFVTLQILGTLRGCIGTLAAVRPLVSDVAYHAHAAAFGDPRFPPLRPDELASLEIHVSILSLPEAIEFDSEADLLKKLRPGVDGLILEAGWHRGTFLPSVWESLPDPREFLRQLKRKAGLPPDYWSSELKLRRYTTEAFGEQA